MNDIYQEDEQVNVSFNKNYSILNDIAIKLREQEQPDIDSLLPMIKDATKAYEQCKQRLAQVESMLQEHFANKS